MHLLDRVVEGDLGQALLGGGPGDRDGHGGRDRAQVAHRRQQRGPGRVASDSRATASAAAAIMRSLIRLARATVTPSPRPGKTSALLAWAMW